MSHLAKLGIARMRHAHLSLGWAAWSAQREAHSQNRRILKGAVARLTRPKMVALALTPHNLTLHPSASASPFTLTHTLAFRLTVTLQPHPRPRPRPHPHLLPITPSHPHLHPGRVLPGLAARLGALYIYIYIYIYIHIQVGCYRAWRSDWELSEALERSKAILTSKAAGESSPTPN